MSSHPITNSALSKCCDIAHDQLLDAMRPLIDACPTRVRYRSYTCRCRPKCAVCGHGPHASVHGTVFGAEPGSKPWGHEYEPKCDCVHRKDHSR